MLVRFVAIVMLAATSVFAQAKVGSPTNSFLEMVPSVRSLSMGGVGAALIDRQSHYSNPATLGLSGDYFLSFAFRPVETRFSDLVRHQSLDLSSRLARIGNDWSLSAALQKIGLSTGPFIERTYQNGTYEGTGRTFDVTAETYSLTVAFARASRLSLGFGGAVQYIEEDFHDFQVNGYSYDLGAVVSYPFAYYQEVDQLSVPAVSLTAGVAVKHFGPHIDLLEGRRPLPSAFHFALALETRSSDLELVLSVEEKISTDFEESRASLGAELGFRDAVWLRSGVKDDPQTADLTTFGAAISIRNSILNVIIRSDRIEPGSGVLRHLDVICSYASSSKTEGISDSGVDHWQIEVVL